MHDNVNQPGPTLVPDNDTEKLTYLMPDGRVIRIDRKPPPFVSSVDTLEDLFSLDAARLTANGTVVLVYFDREEVSIVSVHSGFAYKEAFLRLRETPDWSSVKSVQSRYPMNMEVAVEILRQFTASTEAAQLAEKLELIGQDKEAKFTARVNVGIYANIGMACERPIDVVGAAKLGKVTFNVKQPQVEDAYKVTLDNLRVRLENGIKGALVINGRPLFSNAPAEMPF